MYTDPDTGALVNGIKKIRYTHDAMIDLLISEPTVKQNDLAVIFDRTPAWVSTIMSSDSFKARLEARRSELVDPAIVASIQERLSAVADISLQRLLDRVSGPPGLVTDDFLLKTVDLTTKALGYGARAPSGGDTNIAVVVHVPPKASDPTAWASAHKPLVERVAGL